MTDKQPTALRMADECDEGIVDFAEVAAELRRQHAALRNVYEIWAGSEAFEPEPPPEAQTEAEQRAYTFGWFKALEKSREMLEALQIIATPQRPDGTWNRDREACRQLAAEALGFYNKGE